jgi:hypothetical protein
MSSSTILKAFEELQGTLLGAATRCEKLTEEVEKWKQNSQPWFMWTENKLSLRDRIKILFGWKIYTRFDAPSGQCSGGCDMRHQITLAKYDDVNWQNV